MAAQQRRRPWSPMLFEPSFRSSRWCEHCSSLAIETAPFSVMLFLCRSSVRRWRFGTRPEASAATPSSPMAQFIRCRWCSFSLLERDGAR